MDLIKTFLAIEIIIHPIPEDGIIYYVDLTPKLSLTLPVSGGFRIIKENLSPSEAIPIVLELRKQGLDVVLFPTKDTIKKLRGDYVVSRARKSCAKTEK